MTGARVVLSTPAGALELDLRLPGLYNVYNAVGAVALALELGVPLATVGPALEGFGGAFGRVETIAVDGRPVSILLVKNPAGANEVLRTLTLEEGQVDLWLALNDRIADGRDVSWIWDADFELLAGRVRRVTCTGTRAEEMALRLKYAGIEAEPVVDRDLGAVAGRRGGRRRRGRPPAVRPAHLHGADRAARAAGRPRAGREVGGLSESEWVFGYASLVPDGAGGGAIEAELTGFRTVPGRGPRQPPDHPRLQDLPPPRRMAHAPTSTCRSSTWRWPTG